MKFNNTDRISLYTIFKVKLTFIVIKRYLFNLNIIRENKKRISLK